MLASYYAVVSLLNKKERELHKLKRTDYNKYKKKLFVLDRKKNKKKINRLALRHYPVIKKNNKDYVLVGLLKITKIEDLIPLDLYKNKFKQ